MSYTPQPQDAGCTLRVQCTPGRPSSSPSSPDPVLGAACTAECGPVEAAGPATAALLRAPDGPLAPLAAPAFRAMSYNILADQCAAVLRLHDAQCTMHSRLRAAALAPWSPALGAGAGLARLLPVAARAPAAQPPGPVRAASLGLPPGATDRAGRAAPQVRRV
jgi:hypothetical protein